LEWYILYEYLFKNQRIIEIDYILANFVNVANNSYKNPWIAGSSLAMTRKAGIHHADLIKKTALFKSSRGKRANSEE